jgi:type IV secretory pathway VirB10-like protein
MPKEIASNKNQGNSNKADSKDGSRPKSLSKKSSKNGFNFAISIVIAGLAFWFFTGEAKDKKPQTANAKQQAEKTPQNKIQNKQPADFSRNVAASTSDIPPEVNGQESAPSDLPEGLRRQIMNSPTSLPPEMQAQLDAAPPELPEDLKRQLAMPPRELPADMAAQVMGNPPELPDDIKKALKTPPRVVSIEEVNTPPEPEF